MILVVVHQKKQYVCINRINFLFVVKISPVTKWIAIFPFSLLPCPDPSLFKMLGLLLGVVYVCHLIYSSKKSCKIYVLYIYILYVYILYMRILRIREVRELFDWWTEMIEPVEPKLVCLLDSNAHFFHTYQTVSPQALYPRV